MTDILYPTLPATHNPAELSGDLPLPTEDFIEMYVRYADVLELPALTHEVVGLQLLASILNRNDVWIPHGALELSLDFWTTMLSLSGGGRNTAISLAEPILKAANLRNLILRDRWGSPQAMYQNFAEHPAGLLVWGELSELLRQMNDRQFSGAKEWITDRYDNFDVPGPITYRHTNGKRSDTPPIRFPQAPRINLLATSSDAWFFSHLAQEDSSGGFIPRWVIMRANEVTRIIPTPKQLDRTLVPVLADHLRRVAELRGEACVSLIEEHYAAWYSAARERFMKQANPALAMAYFNRHRTHILKLALLYQVSFSCELFVGEEAWQRAVRTAARIEETLFSLLPTGMSNLGYGVTQMEEMIRKGGVAGVKLSEVTRAFQHQDLRDRKQRLETLATSETVKCFTRPTAGRPGRILVHKDFAYQHSKENLEDKLADYSWWNL